MLQGGFVACWLGANISARPCATAFSIIPWNAVAAAKQAERDRKALQEAVEAGMVQKRGSGKRRNRTRETARSLDGGLREV